MTDNQITMNSIKIEAPIRAHYVEILTPQALSFLEKLERTFGERRRSLLERRTARQKEIDAGVMPNFLPETRSIREDPSWQVAPTPDD